MRSLFHYCSVESLFAILSTKHLRLADASHMNDSHEGRWADGILDRFLQSLSAEVTQTAAEAMIRGYHLNRPHPFLFCLSEEPDLLSQWRGYAADGAGAAIGFSIQHLPRQQHLPSTNAAPSMNTALWQVTYDEEAQFQAMKSLFVAITSSVDFQTNPFYDLVGAQISGLAPIMKNPAFHQEKEWRLIHTPMLLRNAENRHNPVETTSTSANAQRETIFTRASNTRFQHRASNS